MVISKNRQRVVVLTIFSDKSSVDVINIIKDELQNFFDRKKVYK